MPKPAIWKSLDKTAQALVRDHDTPATPEELLDDQGWDSLFRTFAASEFSLENIDFFDAVRAWKNNAEWSRGQWIYDQFLASDAPQEVNLSKSSTRELEAVFHPDIEAILEQREREGSDEPFELPAAPADTFDHLLPPVRSNLYDTYSRFKPSIGDLRQALLEEYRAEIGQRPRRGGIVGGQRPPV